MEKRKSKTNLLQKFAEKFKKKKRVKSTSASREKSSELSKGRRSHRSPSKPKVAATSAGTSNEKSKVDLMEVTAKGIKVKEPKDKDKDKDKKSENNKKRKEPSPSKTPSLMALRRSESQMEVSGNSRNVEKAAKIWMEALEKMDFKKTITADFKPIDSMVADLSKCQVFQKFIEDSQSESVEVLDANRVKGTGDGEFFFHGSILTMPGITTKSTILAQLALQESQQSLEAFWLMVAANKIQRIFVVLGEDELDKKAMSEYFPEDFVEFKTIRVNNRKTVFKTEDQPNTQLYYEVVPKDCAEAPFVMIEICDFWTDGKMPTVGYNRISSTAASVFDSDIDVDAMCAIVSNYGAGRAGSFFVGALAIEKLRAGEVPSIKDIGLSVRSQRPAAIETLSQFVFTYIIALNYCVKHVKDAGLKSRIEKMISQLEQFGCEKMMEEDEDETTSLSTSDSM